MKIRQSLVVTSIIVGSYRVFRICIQRPRWKSL